MNNQANTTNQTAEDNRIMEIWTIAEKLINGKVRWFGRGVENAVFSKEDLKQELYTATVEAIKHYTCEHHNDKCDKYRCPQHVPAEEFKPLLNVILDNRAKGMITYGKEHPDTSIHATIGAEDYDAKTEYAQFADTIALASKVYSEDGAYSYVVHDNRVSGDMARFEEEYDLAVERKQHAAVLARVAESFMNSPAGSNYKAVLRDYIEMPEADVKKWNELAARDPKLADIDFPGFFIYGRMVKGITSLKMNWLVRSIVEYAVVSGAIEGTEWDTEEVRERAAAWRAKRRGMSKKIRDKKRAKLQAVTA